MRASTVQRPSPIRPATAELLAPARHPLQAHLVQVARLVGDAVPSGVLVHQAVPAALQVGKREGVGRASTRCCCTRAAAAATTTTVAPANAHPEAIPSRLPGSCRPRRSQSRFAPTGRRRARRRRAAGGRREGRHGERMRGGARGVLGSKRGGWQRQQSMQALVRGAHTPRSKQGG